MGLFQKFSKHHKELDACLVKVINNAENNYKDAAQKEYQRFVETLASLQKQGTLSEKQNAYYEEMRQKYEQELKGFHH